MSEAFFPYSEPRLTEDLVTLRQKARQLLDLNAPRDGLAAYYALYHDPARTRLWVAERGPQVVGCLALCQTGWDLFRPIGVLRARYPTVARALLREAILPNRPYYLVTTPEYRDLLEEVLMVERTSLNHIYWLDLRRYTPQINVMVTPAPSADGTPRFVVRSQAGAVVAEAGLNWQSPHFAEIYVRTEPQVQHRGWGRAVLDSCVAWVLGNGILPLYVVAEGNEASQRLAEAAGFVDSGAREAVVEGIGKPR